MQSVSIPILQILKYIVAPVHTAKSIFTARVLILPQCIRLLLLLQGGIYVFRIVDHYGANGFVLVLCVFYEATVLGWVFGR